MLWNFPLRGKKVGIWIARSHFTLNIYLNFYPVLEIYRKGDTLGHGRDCKRERERETGLFSGFGLVLLQPDVSWLLPALPARAQDKIRVRGCLLTVCLLLLSFLRASLFICKSRYKIQFLQFWRRKKPQNITQELGSRGRRYTTSHLLLSRVWWVTCDQGPAHDHPSPPSHAAPLTLSTPPSSPSHSRSLSEQSEKSCPLAVKAVNSFSLKFWGPVAIYPLEYHCTSKLLTRDFSQVKLPS